jgi:hypothetical protein
MEYNLRIVEVTMNCSSLVRHGVNCSVLFTERPELERAAAARTAGFDAVEFWWPWAEAVPDDTEVDVVLGEGGVFANGAAGLLFIEMSTIRPDVAAKRVAQEGPGRGGRVRWSSRRKAGGFGRCALRADWRRLLHDQQF